MLRRVDTGNSKWTASPLYLCLFMSLCDVYDTLFIDSPPLVCFLSTVRSVLHFYHRAVLLQCLFHSEISTRDTFLFVYSLILGRSLVVCLVHTVLPFQILHIFRIGRENFWTLDQLRRSFRKGL